ncbi:MAG: YeeE/YedE family protein [Burkholderiales bacterium]
MQIFVAFVVGLLFGVGLIVSGMIDPSKVLGFLDLTGEWDPSLAFVMGGAVLVATIAFGLAAKRSRTLLGDVMRLPTATAIDRRLVFGGALFGVGWGLAGYCPGPALASLALGGAKPLVFVLSLLADMAIFELLDYRSASRRQHAA